MKKPLISGNAGISSLYVYFILYCMYIIYDWKLDPLSFLTGNFRRKGTEQFY